MMKLVVLNDKNDPILYCNSSKIYNRQHYCYFKSVILIALLFVQPADAAATAVPRPRVFGAVSTGSSKPRPVFTIDARNVRTQ